MINLSYCYLYEDIYAFAFAWAMCCAGRENARKALKEGRIEDLSPTEDDAEEVYRAAVLHSADLMMTDHVEFPRLTGMLNEIDGPLQSFGGWRHE